MAIQKKTSKKEALAIVASQPKEVWEPGFFGFSTDVARLCFLRIIGP